MAGQGGRTGETTAVSGINLVTSFVCVCVRCVLYFGVLGRSLFFCAPHRVHGAHHGTTGITASTSARDHRSERDQGEIRKPSGIAGTRKLVLIPILVNSASKQ
jgi:hypothetical protein